VWAGRRGPEAARPDGARERTTRFLEVWPVDSRVGPALSVGRDGIALSSRSGRGGPTLET